MPEIHGAFMCPRPDEVIPGVAYDVPGAVPEHCEHCDVDIMVGPKIQELKRAHPEMPLLCAVCATPQVGAETSVMPLADHGVSDAEDLLAQRRRRR